MKLLIIDDDKDLLMMTSRRLSRKGIESVCASSLSEAKEIFAQNQKFDGIVSDYYLENGENGLSFYEEHVRGVFAGKFVLATGDDRADGRIGKYCKEDSQFSVLEKPFSVETLLGKIGPVGD